MQKPVELRPDAILPGIADDEGCIPIYIEHRYVMSLEAGIYDQLTDSILFSGNTEWHDNEGQGISWRPWLKKPTPEERDAAAWHEPPDEGLSAEDECEDETVVEIRRKTPEEIKRGLRLCQSEHFIYGQCPYAINCDDCAMTDGFVALKDDALSYIEQLEEEKALMLIQMNGDCGCCKHKEERGAVCAECLEKQQRNESNWEYEGLPEVKTDDGNA